MLQRDKNIKKKFKELMLDNIKFVSSMKDVPPGWIKLFHRKKSANREIEEFITNTTDYLDTNKVKYVVCESTDMHKVSGTLGDGVQTHDRVVVNLLNRKVREPQTLLFYSGALFEATSNTAQYNQSQLMMLVDVPTHMQIMNREPLKLFAAPPGADIPEEFQSITSPPTEEDLLGRGWKEVMVRLSRDRQVTESNITAWRRQYTLKHIGASTVNKQMGNTLNVGSAIEVTIYNASVQVVDYQHK